MKLYTKILLWFFLNLLVLAGAFYALLSLQFRLDLDSLLLGRAGERLQAVSEVITAELEATPAVGWEEVLRRFSQAYRVEFLLFRGDGAQVAGEPVTLPAEVLAKVTERRGPFGGMGRGPPPGRGPNRPATGASSEPRPRFMLQTRQPTRYWIGLCLEVPEGGARGPRWTLLAVSKSLHTGGLFPDLTPWVVALFAAVLFSVLFWLPLIRGITRSITQMTAATEQLAAGRFDLSVQSRRRDELGRLGLAIGRLAERLSGYVTGQKRFLGDIAHELCSPIARIQTALGILEQRIGEPHHPYLEDLREDVQQMSDLVGELLSFSKAGLQAQAIRLEPVLLAPLARRVVEREAPDPARVEVRIDENLRVLAQPELLTRALANVLRNALRYGGTAAPITLAAHSLDGQVTLRVADSGPGVPPEALSQLFDPFFRLEPSRSRDSGGVGLGLAIVKTCLEACQGTVTARNRSPSGLEVDLTLPAAPPP